MSKNPKIPDNLGIPDDQANRVREALSKKSVRPEDAVQKAIEEKARDITIIGPDPEDRGWWVGYLLEKLEEEAEKDRKRATFETMLQELHSSLDTRIYSGKW